MAKTRINVHLNTSFHFSVVIHYGQNSLPGWNTHTYKSTKKLSDSSLLQFPFLLQGTHAIFYGESTILSEVTRCLYPETTLTANLNTTGIPNNSVSTNHCSTLNTFIYECLFILRNPTAMKKKTCQ